MARLGVHDRAQLVGDDERGLVSPGQAELPPAPPRMVGWAVRASWRCLVARRLLGSGRRHAALLVLVVVLVGLLAGVAGCSGREPGAGGGVEADGAALRRELLAMRDADQAERTGKQPGSVETDRARAERLRQILDQHGWPTPKLVGVDGVSAAWLIAQHADFDVEFQRRVLELMRRAVAAGDADPSELAFLEDRVAVNTGRPQRYGTQVRCRNRRPAPATPIADPAKVDERRGAVGLEPLRDYLAKLEDDCARE
ncbi:MAG TPA: DUF6624 domain-containing protein [Actinomycetes bacterium]|nr:DUF6624 domain-containing protein [Actinomycetes bacterium]